MHSNIQGYGPSRLESKSIAHNEIGPLTYVKHDIIYLFFYIFHTPNPSPCQAIFLIQNPPPVLSEGNFEGKTFCVVIICTSSPLHINPPVLVQLHATFEYL